MIFKDEIQNYKDYINQLQQNSQQINEHQIDDDHHFQNYLAPFSPKISGDANIRVIQPKSESYISKRNEKQSFMVQDSSLQELKEYCNQVLMNFGYRLIDDFNDVEQILKSLIQILKDQQKQIKNNSNLQEKVQQQEFQNKRQLQNIENLNIQHKEKIKEYENQIIRLRRQIDTQNQTIQKMQGDCDTNNRNYNNFRQKYQNMQTEIRKKDNEIERMKEQFKKPNQKKTKGDIQTNSSQIIELRNMLQNLIMKMGQVFTSLTGDDHKQFMKLVRNEKLIDQSHQIFVYQINQWFQSLFDGIEKTIQPDEKSVSNFNLMNTQQKINNMQNYKEPSYCIDNSHLKMNDQSYISQIQFRKEQNNNILEDVYDKQDFEKWNQYFQKLE